MVEVSVVHVQRTTAAKCGHIYLYVFVRKMKAKRSSLFGSSPPRRPLSTSIDKTARLISFFLFGFFFFFFFFFLGFEFEFTAGKQRGLDTKLWINDIWTSISPSMGCIHTSDLSWNLTTMTLIFAAFAFRLPTMHSSCRSRCHLLSWFRLWLEYFAAYF